MSLQSKAVAGDGKARRNAVRLESDKREKGSGREGRDEFCVDMSRWFTKRGWRCRKEADGCSRHAMTQERIHFQ